MEEKKSGEVKGGKYVSVEETKNGEVKGGKYLEKENAAMAGQRTNEQGNIELLCRWTMEGLDDQLCSMVEK